MTPKIPPTHKTTNPKHREDYVFVEKPGEDFTALKLISGPFASIVYKYGSLFAKMYTSSCLFVCLFVCFFVLLGKQCLKNLFLFFIFFK